MNLFTWSNPHCPFLYKLYPSYPTLLNSDTWFSLWCAIFQIWPLILNVFAIPPWWNIWVYTLKCIWKQIICHFWLAVCIILTKKCYTFVSVKYNFLFIAMRGWNALALMKLPFFFYFEGVEYIIGFIFRMN